RHHVPDPRHVEALRLFIKMPPVFTFEVARSRHVEAFVGSWTFQRPNLPPSDSGTCVELALVWELPFVLTRHV
ncbi:hypothetical protein KI387_031462, partial [Taxus chinensis]